MKLSADIRQKIIDRLSEGESLALICSDEDMPDRRSVQRLQDDDVEFAAAVTCAREDGFEKLAVQAVKDAEDAEDASKGRLAFDAKRWYLGKLSNAFSDKQKHELTGKDGAPIETNSKLDIKGLTDEQLRALSSIPVQSA